MADFARHMEAVARRILGEPNPRHSKKNELRWGTNGSLSVDLVKGTWFSHELQAGGGVLDFIVNEVPGVADSAAAATWLEDNGFIKPGPRQHGGKNKNDGNGADAPHPGAGAASRIVARYDYEDVDGNPVLRVLRYEPKRFSQQHWAAGAWVKGGIPDEEQVPYHLTELLEGIASEYLVYLCEGEKDADALRAIGMVATTNAGGAKHWLPSLNHWFDGAVKVILVEHNDAAGQLRTQEIGKTLKPVVGALEVMRFDDMGPGDDASAWLAAVPGRGAEEWNERAEREAVPWMPLAAPSDAPQPQAPQQKYELQRFDQIKLADDVGYLVKGLLPRKGLQIIYGPPKSGKSFFAFDLFMHVALDRPYRGHRVVQGPVVYFCCEGHSGIPARVEAFRQRFLADHQGPVPFYIITARLNLVIDHAALIASIKAVLGTVKPVAIGIDTLNRSLVGSESKDEDMARYLSAADALWIEFDCLTALIHHSGIEKDRPRGHTSLSGAADGQIKIEREKDSKNLIATVEWMKDGADGERIVSQLEVIEVGKDRDGEPVTSCVVIPAEESSEGLQAANKGAAPLAAAGTILLRALKMAIDEVGLVPPASNHIPPLTKVCTLDQWRDYARRLGLSDGDDPSAFRHAFIRNKEILLRRADAVIWGENAWLGQEEA